MQKHHYEVPYDEYRVTVGVKIFVIGLRIDVWEKNDGTSEQMDAKEEDTFEPPIFVFGTLVDETDDGTFETFFAVTEQRCGDKERDEGDYDENGDGGDKYHQVGGRIWTRNPWEF